MKQGQLNVFLEKNHIYLKKKNSFSSTCGGLIMILSVDFQGQLYLTKISLKILKMASILNYQNIRT